MAASRSRRDEVLADRPGAFAAGLPAWPEIEEIVADGPVSLLTQEVMLRVAADPERRRRLLRVLDHDLPPSGLVTTPLALAALGGGLLRRPGDRRRLLRGARTAVTDELRHLRPPRAA